MVKTSYFGSKLWQFKNANAVAISRGIPQWYRGRVYKALAPPWDLLRIEDEEEYTRRYNPAMLGKARGILPQKVGGGMAGGGVGDRGAGTGV